MSKLEAVKKDIVNSYKVKSKLLVKILRLKKEAESGFDFVKEILYETEINQYRNFINENNGYIKEATDLVNSFK